MAYRVRVWDLPTRLFHWLLAVCVVALVVTGYTGGGAMEWHARLGYTVLTLLLFRLVWGFVGGHWSRFRSFLPSPGKVSAYLRGSAHPDHLVGHNPLGAGSVFAMLLALLVQVLTGMVSDDDAGFTGPLNRFVSSARSDQATWYHKAVGQWLIIALVLLHVAAVVYYLKRKRQNLVHTMVVGDKVLPAPAASSRDDLVSRAIALVLTGACAGLVAWLVSLGNLASAQ
jgi:cytochrome b